MQQQRSTSIVLVPGFLSPRTTFTTGYWGSAVELSTKHSLVVAVSPSGVGSLHDRACEMFAQLTGTTVDYGAEHSSHHNHSRYGRTYAPLVPNWSAEHPLHLVGHSYGGPTARMFHHLLSNGFFGNHFTSEHVKSITTINSPHNGALAVYALGAKPPSALNLKNGSSSSSSSARSVNVVTFSPGWFLGMYCHVHEYFKIFNGMYDFGMDHWPCCASLSGTVRAVVHISPMFEKEDCANYDMTIHAARKTNLMMETEPLTYYVSVVGRLDGGERSGSSSSSDDDDEQQWDNTWMGLFLWFLGTLFMMLLKTITRCKMKQVQKTMSNSNLQMDTSDWLDNSGGGGGGGVDGLVSVRSQQFPLIDASGREPHHQVLDSLHVQESSKAMKPGRWLVYNVNEHHLGIVPFPKSISKQRQFFTELFQLLRNLPASSGG